jgi:hypothetical protein
VIHARLDLSKTRSTAVGAWHGPDGPKVFFCAKGTHDSAETPEIEDDLIVSLTFADAAALCTLLEETVLECINGRAGMVN